MASELVILSGLAMKWLGLKHFMGDINGDIMGHMSNIDQRYIWFRNVQKMIMSENSVYLEKCNCQMAETQELRIAYFQSKPLCCSS